MPTERPYIYVNNSILYIDENDMDLQLIDWIRTKTPMLSVRYGCDSSQSCGLCLVEIEGEAVLSCSKKVKEILGLHITTAEGLPDTIKQFFVTMFSSQSLPPCGYCMGGLLIRIKTFFEKERDYTEEEITHHLALSQCTCLSITDLAKTISLALQVQKGESTFPVKEYKGINTNTVRFGESKIILSQRPFTIDLTLPSPTHHISVVWSEHPLAEVLSIDTQKAILQDGVIGILTAKDIGETNYFTLNEKEYWTLLLGENSVAYCQSEIIAIVIATSKRAAEEAKKHIYISYTVHTPITNIQERMERLFKDNNVQEPLEGALVHTLQYGKAIEDLFFEGLHVLSEIVETIPQAQAPLETPAASAFYTDGHLYVYTQVFDILLLKNNLITILHLPPENIHCIRSETSTRFDTREDYLITICTALCATKFFSSIQCSLTHKECLEYRSKSPDIYSDYTLIMDNNGILQGAKIVLIINIGAYLNYTDTFCETIMKHITSGYSVSNLDARIILLTTNTQPRALMRGKSLETSSIIMNKLIDKLSITSGLDRWSVRMKNIYKKGDYTVFGEFLYGEVYTEDLLYNIKPYYDANPHIGIAISCLDTGITSTNAACMVVIDVVNNGDLIVYHPFPDYGNGTHSLVVQTIASVLFLDSYDTITIRSTTDCMLPHQKIPSEEGAMLHLLYYATKDAAVRLLEEKQNNKTDESLWGKRFIGISTLSTLPIVTVHKKTAQQGNYAFIAQIATANTDEVHKLQALGTFIDAGTLYNPTFQLHIASGGISVSHSSLFPDKHNTSHILLEEFIHTVGPYTKDTTYTYKGLYDISAIALPASVFSAYWCLNQSIYSSYPIRT
ncbi:MAG: molybdopterin cofactor-binding domain-containing protein [Desulfovibrionaceae bacterium]